MGGPPYSLAARSTAALRHLAAPVPQADGMWRIECPCGWTSAPEWHQDALGYGCGREADLLALAERLAKVDTDQVDLIGLVHEAQRLLGGGR